MPLPNPQTDTTVYDAMLKEFYLGPLRQQFNTAKVWMASVRKTGDYIDQSGRRAIMPLLTQWPQGMGARADGGALPQVQSSGYTDALISVVHNYFQLRVTGPAMDASRNSKGAFAPAMEQEMENGMVAFNRDINRQQVNGDGIGRLALITTAATYAAGADVSVGTNPSIDATVNLYEGMLVDVWQAAGLTPTAGTKDADSVQIVYVNANTNTIRFNTAVTTTAAFDAIIREDAKGLELMGVKGLVDDGAIVDTLQGITRTAQPIWQSKVFYNPAAPGTLRNLTLDIIQAPYTHVEKAGYKPFMLSTFELRDRYLTLVQIEKRFVNTMELDGGFKALEYNGTAWVADEQATQNRVDYIVMPTITMHQQSSIKWADEDGKILKWNAGFDSYIAVLRYSAQQSISRPNASASLRDVSPVLLP